MVVMDSSTKTPAGGRAQTTLVPVSTGQAPRAAQPATLVGGEVLEKTVLALGLLSLRVDDLAKHANAMQWAWPAISGLQTRFEETVNAVNAHNRSLASIAEQLKAMNYAIRDLQRLADQTAGVMKMAIVSMPERVTEGSTSRDPVTGQIVGTTAIEKDANQ